MSIQQLESETELHQLLRRLLSSMDDFGTQEHRRFVEQASDKYRTLGKPIRFIKDF